MRLSGICGLISAIFLAIALPVSIVFAHHYWKEKNSRGLGQRRKSRLRKLMWRWIYIAITSGCIGLMGAAGYYLGPIAILAQPSEKQYLSIAGSDLEPLTVGKSPSFTLTLENGPGDTTVNFSDVSIRFTPFVPEKYLIYTPKAPEQLRFTPHKKAVMKWIFNELVVTQDQIDDLNAKTPLAELYFFAKGEWTDESGIKHAFPFCYKYTTAFSNRVAYCSDDIKIK
jgi:hypothetical protein